MVPNRPLSVVAERLRSRQVQGDKCAILMGGGCSASSGVPTPDGFYKILENEFPQACQKAKGRDYIQALSHLNQEERGRMVSLCLDNARLNWSQICLAQLMREGLVQRVYTPNFDSLLAQACAGQGFLPRLYSIWDISRLDPDQLEEPAIIHLRGQGVDLILPGLEEHKVLHQQLLAKIFAQAGSRCLWLVAGCAEPLSPELDQLAKAQPFSQELYWVGEQKDPPAQVAQAFLAKGQGGHHVAPHTSDDFFLALTRELGLFPPPLLTRPFSFLRDLLKSSLPFPATGQRADEANQAFDTPLAWLEEAISLFEDGQRPAAAPASQGQPQASPPPASSPAQAKTAGPLTEEVLLAVRSHFESKQFKEVIAAMSSFERDQLKQEEAYLLSRAHMMQGNSQLATAKKKAKHEAGPLLEDAIKNFSNAVELNATCYQSLNNWGYTLKFQAEMHDGTAADQLLKQAIGKYEQALAAKPDCYQVLNNWGHALKMRAEKARGGEADDLLREAIAKYQGALAIKDDDFTALHNWGNALLAQADLVGGAEGDRLRAEGMKKMKAAQAVMLMRT